MQKRMHGFDPEPQVEGIPDSLIGSDTSAFETREKMMQRHVSTFVIGVERREFPFDSFCFLNQV